MRDYYVKGFFLLFFFRISFSHGVVVFSSSGYDFYVSYVYRPVLPIGNRKSLIYSYLNWIVNLTVNSFAREDREDSIIL